MQMNRLEHDLWVRAAEMVCPECGESCNEQGCCTMLAERIVEMKEELREQT